MSVPGEAMTAVLYFHAPCFDGAVSAVIARRFLVERRYWAQPELIGVNYDVREHWTGKSFSRPCAVVDFLYHPQADFWADHHQTSFLTDELRNDFQARKDSKDIVYDNSAPSCAGLLKRHLSTEFGYVREEDDALVQWAERIDSASYESVQEVIEAAAPALQIASGLALGDQDGYCRRLVEYLSNGSLEHVSQIDEVAERTRQMRSKTQAGLRLMESALQLVDGQIATFDVEPGDAIVNRYSPYYFFDSARYSAGIVRTKRGAHLTTMRNPWREFESVNLGKLCERYGGGGHRRVGSIMFEGPRAAEAASVLQQIITEILALESASREPG
jgi:hypothetical protein